MKIIKREAQIILHPPEDVRINAPFLPMLKTMNGMFCRAVGVHQNETLIREDLIPSLEEGFKPLIGCEHKLNVRSSCQYVVSDDGCVYEVVANSSKRHFLVEIFPDAHSSSVEVLGVLFS